VGKGNRVKSNRSAQPSGGKQSQPAPRKKKAPMLAVTIGITVVLIAFVIAAGTGSSKPVVVDGMVTKTLAQVDECAVATLNLALPAGSDTAEVADDVFNALQGTSGVGKVTVFEEDPRIVVNYCQSFTDESVIRGKLEPTGHLAP